MAGPAFNKFHGRGGRGRGSGGGGGGSGGYRGGRGRGRGRGGHTGSAAVELKTEQDGAKEVGGIDEAKVRVGVPLGAHEWQLTLGSTELGRAGRATWL